MQLAISDTAPAPATVPFDAVADRYDETFTDSRIGTAQRKQVWREIDRVFTPGQRILEINCGTAVDAVHLAAKDIEVCACDNSARMLEVARRRVMSSGLAARVHLWHIPTEQIRTLPVEEGFDGVLSNFGGLNCVEDIAGVARSVASMLKAGAPVVLSVLGRYVAWEMLGFVLQGRFRKAVRRLGSQPVRVRLGDGSVACWYRSVRALRRAFRPYFRLRRWKGIGVSVPPSYFERQARQFPRIMKMLEAADPYLGRTPLIRGLADHLLLTFEKRIS